MIKKIFIVFITFKLTFAFASTWTQTIDSDFSTGNLSNVEISGSGSESSLQLKTTSSSQFGCSLRVEGNSNISLTTSTIVYSIRFTAQNTQTVSKVHLCMFKTGSTALTYNIGLQNDGGIPNHYPNGSWIGGTSTEFPISTITTNGWYPITLSGVSTTAGTIYHIVVKYNSGMVSGSNYLGIYGTTPPMGITSYNESEDSWLTQLQSVDSGTNWTDRTAQPMFIIEGTSTNEGNVYYTYNSSQAIYGNRNFGERITIAGQSKVIRRVSFRVRANAVTPPPNDHLFAVLYNVTDSVKIETVKLVDKSNVTATFEWYTADFSMPITLEVGKIYRVYLESPNSTNLKYYIPYRVEGYNQTYSISDALNFNGTNSVYTENLGSVWTELNRGDILFRLFSATYETSGTFTSSVFDAGLSAFFSQISWLPVSQPANTNINIQIASSNNESGPWNFYGPDGTSGTYYINASGETINAQHTGKRYLKYKVYLESASSSTTPVLNSISISYSDRQMPGTELQTIAFPNPFSPYKNNMSINYILTKDCNVTIKIYTLLGDLVRTLNYIAGSEGGKGDANGYNNKVEWDGRNGDSMIVGNGVYIMRIIAEPTDGSGKITETKRIMVVK